MQTTTRLLVEFVDRHGCQAVAHRSDGCVFRELGAQAPLEFPLGPFDAAVVATVFSCGLELWVFEELVEQDDALAHHGGQSQLGRFASSQQPLVELLQTRVVKRRHQLVRVQSRRAAFHSCQSFTVAFVIARAASCNHFGGCFLKSRTIIGTAFLVPQWTLADSHPIS